MNYYIEKHDIGIILDALQLLHAEVTATDENPDRPYTINDVYDLFVSLYNSEEESWDLK